MDVYYIYMIRFWWFRRRVSGLTFGSNQTKIETRNVSHQPINQGSDPQF